MDHEWGACCYCDFFLEPIEIHVASANCLAPKQMVGIRLAKRCTMNKNTHSKKYDYPVFKWALRIILFLIFTSIVASIFQPERRTKTTENKPSHPTDIETKQNANEASNVQNNSNSQNENLDNADKKSSALSNLFHPVETERVQTKPRVLRDPQDQSISDTTIVAKSSVGGDTWKTVGEIKNTGKDTKSVWVEIRYEGKPGYYQREFVESDCEKRLIRFSQGGTYTDDRILPESVTPYPAKAVFGY